MVKISHLGAKECVTGSCHLIETRSGAADSGNTLVDCGSAQGDDPELLFAQFPVPPYKMGRPKPAEFDGMRNQAG